MQRLHVLSEPVLNRLPVSPRERPSRSRSLIAHELISLVLVVNENGGWHARAPCLWSPSSTLIAPAELLGEDPRLHSVVRLP